MLNKMIQYLKLIKRTLLDIPRFLWGLGYFAWHKRTPTNAHQSLINLFCLTGGYSNTLFSKSISFFQPPYHSIAGQGVLGNFTPLQLTAINEKLNQDGYYIFENKLSAETCEQLLQFSLKEPATIRGDEIQPRKEIYQPTNPLAVRYDYAEQALINNTEVQSLITDPSIIAVAQQYLQSKPILDVIGMWWHTAYQKTPDSSSAQFFHFDMDRIKWLKFFIYLTDVTPDSGPHVFVKGSHRINGIPNRLRSYGYARLSDEQILAAYNKNDIIYHIASKGTIIAEDTRGLHKGQHVIEGNRLVLQLQFSNHLFGAIYPKSHFTQCSTRLKEFIERYPRIYCNYI